MNSIIFASFQFNMLFLFLITIKIIQRIVKNNTIYYCYFISKLIAVWCMILPILISILSKKLTISVKGSDFHFITIYNIMYHHNFIPYTNILFFIWLFIFWILFFKNFIKSFYYIKRLEKISYISNDILLETIKRNIQKSLGIKKNIKIYICDLKLRTPAFITGIKPKIFLEDKDYTERELEILLKHEIMHYKNGDSIFQYIMTFLSCFYWFHPLFILFIKNFYEDCEMMCDQSLIQNETKTTRFIYAETVLKYTKNKKETHFLGFSNSHQYKFIKRRITYIMRKNKKVKKYVVSLLAIAFLMITPVTSYATAKSLYLIQNQTEIKEDYNLEEEYREIENRTDNYHRKDTTLNFSAKGANFIDCSLNNERLVVESIELEKNAKVQFIIAAANTTDKFKAGVIKDGKKRYVDSFNGTISYTFTISEAGSYDLFIESFSKVQITGSITIR